MTVFPVIIQTNIIAQILSTGMTGDFGWAMLKLLSRSSSFCINAKMGASLTLHYKYG